MDSRRPVKPRKKSLIPGVTIKQLVQDIPEGYSLPDFERKPITLTLQEGKNAMFRAMVKGEPAPKVIWKRSKEEMNNPDKYQTSFNAVTNEFILQINKLTAEDTDVYHCSAVNEYGEASCAAGLKVIQVNFKKNAKPFPTDPQDDLKKELQDFRKLLKKRAPVSVQKKEIDMEQVWQLLLNADRKDYEKICLKYGIVDFRGMLRKLQQMKKDREDKQQQYVYSVTNLKHIKVNNEGNATFHLEMDLKSPDSRIYLYKDGQMINYGFNDDKVKHCLRRTGKKYNFTINHLQPEDAGVYQIKVEDVDVFSTQLEADSIPMGFRHLLSEVRCHEQGNAVFECSLYSPCYDATWLYKNHPIEKSDKYQISISPDGLTHRLVIKNTLFTDTGTYTLDTRSCTSSAWLEVEPAREKRGQAEGDRTDKTGWQTDKSMLPDEKGAKKLLQRESLGHQNHLKRSGVGKDGQYGSNQDDSREIFSSIMDDEWHCGSLERDGLSGRVGKDGRMERGQFSGAGPTEGSVTNGTSNKGGHKGKTHGQDCKLGRSGVDGTILEVGLRSFYGKDSRVGGAGSGSVSVGSGGLSSIDGRETMLAGAAAGLGVSKELGSLHGMEGGAGLGEAGGVGFLCGKDGMLGGAGVGFGGAGEAGYHYGKDAVLGEVGAGGMGDLGGRDAILGTADVGTGLGAGGVGSLCGKDCVQGGIRGPGTALDRARDMSFLSSKCSMRTGDGDGIELDVGAMGDLGGRDAILGESDGGDAGGSISGQDGVLRGAGVRMGLEDAIGMRALGTGDSVLGTSDDGGAGGSVSGQGVLCGAGVGVRLEDAVDMNALGSRDSVLGATDDGGAGGSVSGREGMLCGADVGAGLKDAVGMSALGNRDSVLGASDLGAAGLAGAGGVSSLSGKDGRQGGASVEPTGAGSVMSFCQKDGMLSGAGACGAGLNDAYDRGCLYDKNGMTGGARAGVGGFDAGVNYSAKMGILPDKDIVLGGISAGLGGAGGLGSLFSKDGVFGTDQDSERNGGHLCGEDSVLGEIHVGLGGAGRTGSLCGKDPIFGGSGVAAAGSAGAGGMSSSSGMDALLSRVGAGGVLDSIEGIGAIDDRDARLGGAGAGGAEVGAGVGSLYGKETMVGAAHVAGGMSALDGRDSVPSTANAGSLYGQDGMVGGTGPGSAGLSGAGGMESLCGKDLFGGTRASGAGWLDSIHDKGSVQGAAGPGTGGEVTGAERLGLLDGSHSLLDRTVANGGLGHFGSLYGRDPALGDKLHNGSLDGRMPGVHSEGSLSYDQMSGHDGEAQVEGRRGQISGLDSMELSPEENLKNRERKRRGFLQDEARDSPGHFDRDLSDVSTQKGKPAVLPCSLSSDHVEEIWLKDEFKLPGLDEISSEKDDLVYTRIIDTVEDNSARKYKLETGSVKTEASVSIEDPPSVDKGLLEKLMKEPMVVKAGQNAMVKIPFKGQKPVRVTWLKDGDELLDDTRIHIDKADNFTRLSITSTNRKDCGDYNVKLKNECGTLKASLKLVVTDKPQKPIGPIEVVACLTTGMTIRWKPPKDDGGKPVQNYIIERKQVGRKTWVTLGETNGSNTTFTTDKVEHDKSYCFRVRAVNAEGSSEVLESDEVVAAGKAFPRAPAPPKIVSANKDSITLSWAAPPKAGKSRILGYIVEKRKKGSNVWTPVTDLPITARKLRVTDLKEGLQYEFRVAVVNAAGAGEASAPSDAAFARESMKPPGRVKDLKVTSTDYTSITLTWTKPDSDEDGSAKGYEVEKRSSDTLKWTRCNSAPIGRTTYTVKGLQAREMYFLRVRAINEGGLGEAVELDTCIQAVPPIVNPKFLRDDTMKNFMIIRVGSCIRVRVPFEASPAPAVIWLKDGLPLPRRAIVNTRDGLSQLLIPSAEFSDSGFYTITLQNDWGRKVSFSFQVKVTDIPEPPGPIWLQEKVLSTVTVFWEPSPTEKQESNLYYVVMKRDTSKSSWQVVGDLIFTNKFTITKLIPGRGYYFRVVAKNDMGTSNPSETVQPWIIKKEKDEFKVRLPKYKHVNKNMPPRFLVQLKPHVVTTAFDCHMSCAVSGYPKPKIAWYKDGRNLSEDPTFFTTNDFGVCCLMIPDVTKGDEGEYQVEASNELGHAVSKAMLIIKGSMYDGLTDGLNYGTARGSYYAKTQTGNSSWGYPMYNGTLKRETDSRRYSSYSQMEGWGSRQHSKLVCSPTSPGSDYCLKASRSEPDLCSEAPWGTLRRGQVGSRGVQRATLNRQSLYSSCNTHHITSRKPVLARTPSCTSGNSGTMTIQKAIQLLCSLDEKSQAMGAYYLQHTCFQDESAKQEVYRLNGIAKLIELLRSTNQNVQQAAAGALRNLVFRNPANKLETRRQNGIRECVNLLRGTRNTEIQKQLTGLLWNLSSTDELKEDLIHEALPVLTDCVIIPFSGWSDGISSRSKEIVDPEVFFNATGCLRNLSSADAGRHTMRNYPGLIDSVMTYTQNCVAACRPDDKSVENCICILHNLSYRLDAEVPNKYTQLNHMARNAYMDKSLTGCFNNRSGRLENDEFDLPLPEEDYKPRGPSWLYHSDAIRTYLNLMDYSKKDATLEACAGALQNLTASRGLMSNAMSQLIGLKEKGLPRIARLLQSNNSDVVRSGASLLSNMSRHPILHKIMAPQVLPDVSRLLSFQSVNNSNFGEIMTSACYTMRNLIMSNPQMAKPYLTSNMLNNLVNLCRNGSSPKAADAARLLLSDLWSNRELQSVLKQQGFNKNMFGSLAGSTFRNLSSRF